MINLTWWFWLVFGMTLVCWHPQSSIYPMVHQSHCNCKSHCKSQLFHHGNRTPLSHSQPGELIICLSQRWSCTWVCVARGLNVTPAYTVTPIWVGDNHKIVRGPQTLQNHVPLTPSSLHPLNSSSCSIIKTTPVVCIKLWILLSWLMQSSVVFGSNF